MGLPLWTAAAGAKHLIKGVHHLALQACNPLSPYRECRACIIAQLKGTDCLQQVSLPLPLPPPQAFPRVQITLGLPPRKQSTS